MCACALGLLLQRQRSARWQQWRYIANEFKAELGEARPADAKIEMVFQISVFRVSCR